MDKQDYIRRVQTISRTYSCFLQIAQIHEWENSLELLLLKENISRSELRKLLLSIEEHIISVRHW